MTRSLWTNMDLTAVTVTEAQDRETRETLKSS